jgi:asparaginyl-tRNA synthetase
MSNVYTFGPTFRAENSNTNRHLAEFWMIEPEFAFADLYDNMDAAEAYVKFCIRYVLENNMEDLKFMNERVRPGLIDYLHDIVKKDFVRCSYTEGIAILEEAIKLGAQFEKPVSWGIDLGSEHERFIAEKVFKRPVFLYEYPKAIKAFYMKVTDDGKKVRAMDMLIPLVGELIGGS